ncbi:hypothetical protein FRB99_000357 [Tulasnella sp. 403]|nr:hypothetical protein FRB99_000357 [Tulasnella sp. 403]
MQLFKSLATFVTVCVCSALATNPTVSLPQLFYLGSGTSTVSSAGVLEIDGPLGLRVSESFTGGTITDSKGRPLAKIISGETIENGIVDSNNEFHVDARSTWLFSDGKYGFVTLQGIGPLGGNFWAKVAVETGSTTYAYLNTMFIVANITQISVGLHLDFFSFTAPPS